MPTTGPIEPATTRTARDQYWKHRAWLEHLETRITRTPRGLDWLTRVKAI